MTRCWYFTVHAFSHNLSLHPCGIVFMDPCMGFSSPIMAHIRQIYPHLLKRRLAASTGAHQRVGRLRQCGWSTR
jgi:hypothetical protein